MKPDVFQDDSQKDNFATWYTEGILATGFPFTDQYGYHAGTEHGLNRDSTYYSFWTTFLPALPDYSNLVLPNLPGQEILHDNSLYKQVSVNVSLPGGIQLGGSRRNFKSRQQKTKKMYNRKRKTRKVNKKGKKGFASLFNLHF